MKKTIITLSLFAGAFTAYAGSFSVDVSALYVMPDIDESYASTISPLGDDEFDDTFGFSVKANYELDNSGFSFGPEFLYFGTDSDSGYTGTDLASDIFDSDTLGFLQGLDVFNLLDSGFSSDEDYDFYGGMFNVYYDFTWDKLSVTAGLGIGYMYIEHAYSLSGVLAGSSTELIDFDGDDGVIAYQFILGVDYSITDSISAFLAYRYLGMEDPSFDYGIDGPFFGTELTPDYEPSISAHAVELGVSYSF